MMADAWDDEAERGPDYLAPTSVDEALALLAEHGDAAKIVGGAQSLAVFLRQGLIAPAHLIGLRSISELSGITEGPDGGLVIGAMVTQHAIETSNVIRARFPALAEAAAAVASPPVRRQGTLGGNLCHADPTGDPPAALIALMAEVEIASINGRRCIPAEDLARDYMETILEPHELLVAVHLPTPPAHSGSAYLKHRLRGIDTAIVGAGVGLTLADDKQTCLDIRIGLVGVGVTPERARTAEDALRGRTLTDEAIRAAARIAADACEPMSDTEASSWYRQEMVAVFVRRAAEIALDRARRVQS
jgi:aerobic carbon-monoxide dehydrogenase medium subunit